MTNLNRIVTQGIISTLTPAEYVGKFGELTVDTETGQISFHNGVTTGGISPNAGTGAVTAVAGVATLNTMAGKVTSEALIGATTYSLTLHNDKIFSTSVVMAQAVHLSGGWLMFDIVTSAGQVVFTLTEFTGSPLNGTMTILFSVSN